MKTGKKTRYSVLVSDFHAGYLKQYQEKRALYSKRRSSKVIFATMVALFSFVVGFSSGRIFAPASTTSAVSAGEISIETTTQTENITKDHKSPLEKSSETALVSKADIPKPVYSLVIPSIGLYANITPTYVNENNDIVVPGNGIGLLTSYKGRSFNLLVGHRANVFRGLSNIHYGDIITYYGEAYQVATVYQQAIPDIDMYNLTSNSSDLRLMTCAGENNSERLVIIAKKL